MSFAHLSSSSRSSERVPVAGGRRRTDPSGDGCAEPTAAEREQQRQARIARWQRTQQGHQQ